nr:unnamed protein product [Callosobruchus chinensis]
MHPAELLLTPRRSFFIHQELSGTYDRTFVSEVSRAWNGLPGHLLNKPSKNFP